MKKISIRILILVVAFVVLSLIESKVMVNAYEMNYIRVYVAKERIKTGTLITESLVEPVDLQENVVTEDMMRDIPNKYAIVDYEKNQFIYQSQLSYESPIELLDDERMITIKCSIVEGNGWSFEINETVDIVMVSPEEHAIIKNARVCRVFNEMYGDNDPEYISLIVSESEALIYYQQVSKSQVFIAKKK